MTRIVFATLILIVSVASSWATHITDVAPDYDVKTPTLFTDPGPAAAHAIDEIICIPHLPTFNDGLGEAINEVFAIDIGGLGVDTPFFITDIAWDINLETFGASWASEATFSIDTDLSAGVFLAPGAGDDMAVGPTNYSGSAALGTGLGGVPFQFSSDGILTIELFESFDDVSGAADATLLAPSTITFGVTDAFGDPHTVMVKWVPEPASIAMIVVLAGFSVAGLRRWHS